MKTNKVKSIGYLLTVGGWVHGGPGLLRSSSSTDLRNVQDQVHTDYICEIFSIPNMFETKCNMLCIFFCNIVIFSIDILFVVKCYGE